VIPFTLLARHARFAELPFAHTQGAQVPVDAVVVLVTIVQSRGRLSAYAVDADLGTLVIVRAVVALHAKAGALVANTPKEAIVVFVARTTNDRRRSTLVE
jgi:hypothetical protein